MKVGVALVLFVAIAAAVYVGFSKGERVSGVAVLAEAEEVDAVLFELLEYPLTEDETLLFLEGSDSVLDWAAENAEEWLAADEAEQPLSAVRSLGVWRKSDLGADEFTALVAKLMFTKEIQGEGNSVGAMRKELAEMEITLKDESIPSAHRELIRQGYEQFQRLIAVVESSGPQNLALYVKYQDRIDAALGRFDAVGE